MDKKTTFRTGLVFGGVMAVCFICFNLLTRDPNSRKSTLGIVLAGLLAGAIVGLVYALALKWFTKSRMGGKSIQFELEVGEEVVFQTPANHNKGMEAVGGLLLLTNKRLVFKSHKVNIQNHELSLSRSEILSSYRFKSFGMVNNGLKVTLRNGTEEKFVVQQAEVWVEQLGGVG